MTATWHFNEFRPCDKARESQVEKFFNSDAVANPGNAIVREGIQNSLDAAPNDAQVTVRLTEGLWSEAEARERLPRYSIGFGEHLKAVRGKLANPPSDRESFRFLVFEDFGTYGLRGDPEQWKPSELGQSNPFFNYFRAEGISDKVEGSRGRHGVGKFVFAAASRARAMFGLTRRDDGRQLLMGTAVLHNHAINGKPFLPDGWFGVESPAVSGLILPVEQDRDFIAQFRRDFSITRGEENGLSVVVPYLKGDLHFAELLRHVIDEFFHPIMRNKLVVELIDADGKPTQVNAANIRQVADSQGEEAATSVRPLLALSAASLRATDFHTLCPPPGPNSPKWSEECLPAEVAAAIHAKLEAGELVALRCPMTVRPKSADAPKPCSFDIFLLRDSTATEGQVEFIREGIRICDVRPRRTPGVRALVVIDEGPLATFLGDSENPSHTQWQHEAVKENYTYPKAYIQYVVQSVPGIMSLLSETQKQRESTWLVDLFSLPPEEETDPKTKRPKKQKAGTDDADHEAIKFKGNPRRFDLQKLSDGFVIRHGDPEAERPGLLEVRAAYGVRRGSPFARYNPADFRFDKPGLEIEIDGGDLVERENNRLLVRVVNDGFRIAVTGFDTNRDLHIDTKARDEEPADAATT